jgi:hypothetical protein
VLRACFQSFYSGGRSFSYVSILLLQLCSSIKTRKSFEKTTDFFLKGGVGAQKIIVDMTRHLHTRSHATKKVHRARINIFFFIIFKRGYSRFVPKLHSFKVGSTDLRFFLLRVGSLESHSVRCILSFYDGFVRSRVASCSLFTEKVRVFQNFARVEDVNFSAIRDSRSA